MILAVYYAVQGDFNEFNVKPMNESLAVVTMETSCHRGSLSKKKFAILPVYILHF